MDCIRADCDGQRSRPALRRSSATGHEEMEAPIFRRHLHDGSGRRKLWEPRVLWWPHRQVARRRSHLVCPRGSSLSSGVPFTGKQPCRRIWSSRIGREGWNVVRAVNSFARLRTSRSATTRARRGRFRRSAVRVLWAGASLAWGWISQAPFTQRGSMRATVCHTCRCLAIVERRGAHH